MAAIRREQEEAEVKECSFKPQINSKSAHMVQQRQQILKVGVGSWLPAGRAWWSDGFNCFALLLLLPLLLFWRLLASSNLWRPAGERAGGL